MVSVYSCYIGKKVRRFDDFVSCAENFLADRLEVDTSKGFIEVAVSDKSVVVALKDVATGKLVKELDVVTDVVKHLDFTLAHDGLYYSKEWSTDGKTIEVDGLGYTLAKVTECYVENNALVVIADKLEGLKDGIRTYFK